MPTEMPTLAAILTIEGAAMAAMLITGTVEILKRVFSIIGTRHWEQALALLFSMILVLLAAFSIGVHTLDAAFTVFVAWLAIAKLATGIHDEATAAEGSFRAPPP
jgi:uncharacterized membrane protein HdeD (DUF308 family)